MSGGVIAQNQRFMPPFTPAALFVFGEPGCWYDPSDLTTMFQDESGTVPVTAADQPIGLILDKRLGLTLGSEKWVTPILGTTWVANGDGSITSTNPTGGYYSASLNTLSASTTYLISFDYVITGGSLTVRLGTIIKNTLPSGSGSVTMRALSTTSQLEFVRASAGVSQTVTLSNISVRELSGNHASQSLAASRPMLRKSGAQWYMEFDGVDDGLRVDSINFTGSGDINVSATVEKTSDAKLSVLVELISGGARTFTMFVPRDNGQPGYGFRSGGTALMEANANLIYPAPELVTLTGEGSISTPRVGLRRNGVTIKTNGTSQGTGTLNVGSLNIGARSGGISFPFTGKVYGLVIKGAILSENQLRLTERYLANLAGTTI